MRVYVCVLVRACMRVYVCVCVCVLVFVRESYVRECWWNDVCVRMCVCMISLRV